MAQENNISAGSECDSFQSESHSVVLQVMIVTVLAISTVGGNALTLVTFIGSRYLRNAHGLIIISLALSDFGMGFVSMGSIYPAAVQHWPYQHVLCVLQGCIFEVCYNNSFFMTIFLSIERYLAVTRPYQYTHLVTRKRVTVLLCVTWLIPFLGYGVPTALQKFKYRFNESILMCLVKFRQLNNLSVGAVFLWFMFTFTTFGLMTYTGARVTMEMRNIAEKRLRQVQHQFKRNPMVAKHAVHTFKISAVILVAFYVLRSPYIGTILATAAAVDKCSIPDLLVFTTYWVAMINGCFNFFVYVIMNRNFRREFRRLVLRQGVLPPKKKKSSAGTNDCNDSKPSRSAASIQLESSNSSRKQ